MTQNHATPESDPGHATHQARALALYERLASSVDAIAPLRRTLLTFASPGNDSLEAATDAWATLESIVEQLESEATQARIQGDVLAAVLDKSGARKNGGHTVIGHGSSRNLEELILAQRKALLALNQQLSTVESLSQEPLKHGQEVDRPCGAVEIQDVSEFLQESPIASVPVNASYYVRILEAAQSPEGHRRPMGAILLKAGIISTRQLENALRHQREGRKRPLGALLVDLGYTTDTAIAQTIAAQLALPFVLLSREPVKQDALDIIPIHLARRHACFPVRINDGALYVAMANPLDLIALEDLRLASNKHVRPCVASREEISDHINKHYAGSAF